MISFLVQQILVFWFCEPRQSIAPSYVQTLDRSAPSLARRRCWRSSGSVCQDDPRSWQALPTLGWRLNEAAQISGHASSPYVQPFLFVSCLVLRAPEQFCVLARTAKCAIRPRPCFVVREAFVTWMAVCSLSWPFSIHQNVKVSEYLEISVLFTISISPFSTRSFNCLTISARNKASCKASAFF